MMMTFNNDWLRCKAALEAAARIDLFNGAAWLDLNERFALQTLATRCSPKRRLTPEMHSVILTDIIERHVGLHADERLPDPPNDSAHYLHWVRTNCFRLNERLRALGSDIDTFSWLRREYLRAHGRLVK